MGFYCSEWGFNVSNEFLLLQMGFYCSEWVFIVANGFLLLQTSMLTKLHSCKCIRANLYFLRVRTSMLTKLHPKEIDGFVSGVNFC